MGSEGLFCRAESTPPLKSSFFLKKSDFEPCTAGVGVHLLRNRVFFLLFTPCFAHGPHPQGRTGSKTRKVPNLLGLSVFYYLYALGGGSKSHWLDQLRVGWVARRPATLVATSHPTPPPPDFPKLHLKPPQEQKNSLRPLKSTPGSPLRQENGGSFLVPRMKN